MKVLNVLFHGFHESAPVAMGRLAYRRGVAAFEYSNEFLSRAIEVSPIRLHLQAGLVQCERGVLNGLHGLFNDSLPDGWGLLLMDRAFQSRGIDPSTVSPIDRLAFVGSRGMGALSYEPDEGVHNAPAVESQFDLAKAGAEATQIFEGTLEEVIDYHTIHGTPSGGARPKLLIGIDSDGFAIAGSEDLPTGYEHWIVKFPTGSTPDKKAEGAMEYVFAKMAKASGIEMAEPRLIPADDSNAYFASKRFDRIGQNERNHIHSVAGLLNTNFRDPNYDYIQLIKLTLHVTKSVAEQREVFLRMLFNVISGNRDDHTKNFAFMMSPDGEWRNTPAFDVTFNEGIAGEHNMTISGKGKGIDLEDVLKVGAHASLTEKGVLTLVEQVRHGTSLWGDMAKGHGVPKTKIDQIETYINKQSTAFSPLRIVTFGEHLNSIGDDPSKGEIKDGNNSKGPSM
jgi:serine/threonine-protein kinase HipA